MSIFFLRIFTDAQIANQSVQCQTVLRTIKACRCSMIGYKQPLPSGSRSLVTPYSRSATKKTLSSRSRGWLERAVLQSTRSGRFLWRRALKARPSLQEQVKSVTRTPGYRAVVRRAHLRRASRAVTFGSWPTTMSDI